MYYIYASYIYIYGHIYKYNISVYMHVYGIFDAHNCTRQYVQRVHLNSTGNRASVRVRVCLLCDDSNREPQPRRQLS